MFQFHATIKHRTVVNADTEAGDERFSKSHHHVLQPIGKPSRVLTTVRVGPPIWAGGVSRRALCITALASRTAFLSVGPLCEPNRGLPEFCYIKNGFCRRERRCFR